MSAVVEEAATSKAPVPLGSMLFTLVEPRPGHEVAYNRWYERDHFYAGCMIGPWLYAGRRFVATRSLKALREPDQSVVFDDVRKGSYLALYFVEAGHHDEHFDWAVEQVNWLHANGRMFEERDHVHTVLYEYEWAVRRDADGVPPDLALHHPFAGLAVEMIDPAAGRSRSDVQRFLREEGLPAALEGGPVALTLAFRACPLPEDAPPDVPRVPGADERTLLLHFLEDEPTAGWAERFEGSERYSGSPCERVWAAPFIPTIPGTDRYTDEL